jgi:crossover junction endodeoxyribonuclease RusA
MKTFTIHAHGNPAAKGSKSFKGMFRDKRTGQQRAILAESSKKEAPWSDAVARAIILANAREPMFFDGAVRLSLDFVMVRGTTEKKVTRQMTRAPDIDKLCRSVCDSITRAALWKDDSLVIELRATKRTAELGEPAGCIIKIEDIAVAQIKRGKKEPVTKPLKLADDSCPYFV